MKRILTGAAVLGFAVLASSSASAQDVSRSSDSVRRHGWRELSNGRLQRSAEDGWNAGALLNFGFVNSPVALRVDGRGISSTSRMSPTVRTSACSTRPPMPCSTSARREPRAVLPDRRRRRVQLQGHRRRQSRLRLLQRTATTKFGLNGGVGVKFTAGPVAPFVEARYHYVFSGNSFTNDNGRQPEVPDDPDQRRPDVLRGPQYARTDRLLSREAAVFSGARAHY